MANVLPIVLNTNGQLERIQSGDTVPAANIELDTDGTLAANSDTKIASQKAVKTYIAANGGSPASMKVFMNTFFN